MDITWVSIGKIVIAGLATYVLLPAALILRDFLLWKLIDAYILNDTLRSEVRKYAYLADNWNKSFVEKKTFDAADDDFREYLAASQKLSDEINKSKLFIDRKSQFLTWLLKHYKQDAPNPIGDWKRQAKDEIERRAQKNS